METRSSNERAYRFAAGVVLSAFALVAASAGVLYWYRAMLHDTSPAPDINEGGAVAEADQAIANGEAPAAKESLPENGSDGVVLGAYASTTAVGAASDTVAVPDAIPTATAATNSASSSSDPYASSSDEDCL